MKKGLLEIIYYLVLFAFMLYKLYSLKQKYNLVNNGD